MVGSADIVVDVVDVVIVVFVILVVVAFMLTDIVLLIGGVAAVVDSLQGYLFEITSGWLLTEFIVTILAKHIATNIISQIIIL